MKFHDNIIQGTPEWLELRAHRFGGTDAAAVVTGGKGMDTLIYKKVAAKHFFEFDDDGFVSPAMQRGNDLEPLAREEYELDTFSTVEETGYVSWGEWFGVSPDGLVGDDGAIEIKCPMGGEFLRTLDNAGDPPGKHMAQMQWLLFITGREWCDYVVYHPDAATLIRRINRNESTMDLFADRCKEIVGRIEDLELKLKTGS